MFVFRVPSRGARRSDYVFASLALSVLLAGVRLASCSNPFGGNSQPSPTATLSPDLPLAKLHWCGKPAMSFRDEGAVPTTTATATAGGSPTATATASATVRAGTPTTLTDWSVVKTNLGFGVYLPANLPRGTCLVSAQATVHDPTFGGSFLIGYLLPDHTSITISEAPLTSQNASFQCNVSNSSSTQKNNPPSAGTPQATVSPTATPVPLQLCSGAHETTNIVLSARRSEE